MTLTFRCADHDIEKRGFLVSLTQRSILRPSLKNHPRLNFYYLIIG